MLRQRRIDDGAPLADENMRKWPWPVRKLYRLANLPNWLCEKPRPGGQRIRPVDAVSVPATTARNWLLDRDMRKRPGPIWKPRFNKSANWLFMKAAAWAGQGVRALCRGQRGIADCRHSRLVVTCGNGRVRSGRLITRGGSANRLTRN